MYNKCTRFHYENVTSTKKPVLHPGIKSDEEEAIINDNRCSLFQSIDFIICLNLCIVHYPYLTKQQYYGNSSTTRLAYYINPKTDFEGLKMRYWPLFSSFPYTPTNTSAYCRRDLSPFSIQKNTNNSRRYISREKSCTTTTKATFQWHKKPQVSRNIAHNAFKHVGRTMLAT